MGMTSKDIQTYLWIFLEFSMKLICTYVREHPLPSFVCFVFIILYVFFSSIFWFLIYSLPLLLMSGIVVIVLYGHERPKDDVRNRGKIEDEGGKKKKCVGRARSVRRRKSKKDFPPYVEDNGGSIFLPEGFGDHHVFDKSTLTEEEEQHHMKDIREVVEVHSVTECCSSFDRFSKDWQKKPAFRRSRYEGEIKMLKNDDSDDNGEENVKRSKGGVQWTTHGHPQNKKNLMDLSEMERNKRLESLMARRRARRLVSIHVRRTLMNLGSDDPPISIMIPRTNSNCSSNGGLFSPSAPGSAPSVLLKNRNPFDLPYDQHEEKPNLSGGSFQHDFMVPQQDLMFCRHESFALGGGSFFGEFESDVDLHNVESSENYRSRTPFAGKEDAADELMKQVSVEEPEKLNHVSPSNIKEPVSTTQYEEDNGEVQIKSVLIEDIDDDRTSSSSSSPSESEEDEPFYRIDKNAIIKSLSTPPAPRNNITTDNQENCQEGRQIARMDENYYFAKFSMFPTPSHSIASDLQVEVSELGSPPRSVDGTSSLEEEISVYNRDMDEKDTSDTLWAASSGLNQNESRSREAPKVTEQDLVEVGFSSIHPTQIISPEGVIQQDSDLCTPTHAANKAEENDILELIKRNSHEKQGAELDTSEDSNSPADLEEASLFPPKSCNLDQETEMEVPHYLRNQEVLYASSIEEAEGLTKPQIIAHKLESYNPESFEEESTNDSNNPSVILESDGLPEHKTSAHHSESHDHKEYPEEDSASNHTDSSVILDEILN
ncbi:unnamed protein product, partial [Cuscuta europaea]